MISDKNFMKERHLLLFDDSIRTFILLDQDEYNIGRGLLNEIVLNGDPISRIHARIRRSNCESNGGFQYQIFDGISDEKPSKNGIFINEVRRKEHILKTGDIIFFANIIKAVYVKENLSDIDFQRFKEKISSDFCEFSSFFSDEIIAVIEANLSNLECTTIMLGGSSIQLKDTISLRR